MTIASEAVLAYLQQHPEFLHTHAAELGYRAAAAEGKVLSFQQGRVDALKHKTERMAAQLAVMLDNAEYNRRTAAKLQRFKLPPARRQYRGAVVSGSLGGLGRRFRVAQPCIQSDAAA